MLSSYRGNAGATSPQASNKPIYVTFSGGSGPGVPIGEVPAGTIDGANAIFTLTQTPISGSLLLQSNGTILKPALGYTLSGLTITYLTTYIPQVGDILYANYQYTP